ncbi:uncharacterized protein [Gossypium hirsutum]|uniref:G-patch domain-containing protein n=1 Tax=Gossypium hirsutum TaxID=3635 RepID=A0ABM2YX59_GOSHI|nr:uncharacterized protein LOC121208021 [Gossypium hirsutum]
MAPRVIIQKPVSFPYKDRKRVPWNYDYNVTIPGKENPTDASGESQDVGFYIRSGRHYDPVSTRTKIVKEKASTVEQRKEKTVKIESPINEPVTEKKAREFLKFLKHNEYNVVEQLHKQPARISVLALLLSSEKHRSALMKELNETHVVDDISVNKLDRMVNNISANNFIFFNDEKIPPGGMGSTKALHITTRCKGYTLLGVLIDNGSALNVLPLSALNRLPVDSSHMKTCQNIVRAFDGIERKVIWRIEIPLLIDPSTYKVDFLVMDIKPSYNCLLGRPWIHLVEAVPSLLHQKLKFITEGRLVTVNVEEDIITSVTSEAPYVGTDDEAIECSFRSLEFVNATFIVERNKVPTPKISKTTRMGLQLTVGKGALPRRGLGRNLQGKVEAPMLTEKRDRFGLGYKPVARTFVSRGTIYSEGKSTRKGFAEEMLEGLSINVIPEEETREENQIGISPYAPGSVLNNWTEEEVPVTFKINSKSQDINDMSNAATGSASPFEQDMCTKDPQDFEDNRNFYVNQKAIKGSAIADFLASRPLEDYEPLSFDFPNQDLMYVTTMEEDSQEDHPWRLNFDGASNVVGNRIGVVLLIATTLTKKKKKMITHGIKIYCNM